MVLTTTRKLFSSGIRGITNPLTLVTWEQVNAFLMDFAVIHCQKPQLCPGDGIGIHTWLKPKVLRVRLPPRTPKGFRCIKMVLSLKSYNSRWLKCR